MMDKYLIEYPNEPYFVKSEVDAVKSDHSDLEEKSIKLLIGLEKISKEDQPEAMGLLPIHQATGLNSQEFYNAMCELIDKEYITVDHSTAPARTLIVSKA